MWQCPIQNLSDYLIHFIYDVSIYCEAVSLFLLKKLWKEKTNHSFNNQEIKSYPTNLINIQPKLSTLQLCHCAFCFNYPPKIEKPWKRKYWNKTTLWKSCIGHYKTGVNPSLIDDKISWKTKWSNENHSLHSYVPRNKLYEPMIIWELVPSDVNQVVHINQPHLRPGLGLRCCLFLPAG